MPAGKILHGCLTGHLVQKLPENVLESGGYKKILLFEPKFPAVKEDRVQGNGPLKCPGCSKTEPVVRIRCCGDQSVCQVV